MMAFRRHARHCGILYFIGYFIPQSTIACILAPTHAHARVCRHSQPARMSVPIWDRPALTRFTLIPSHVVLKLPLRFPGVFGAHQLLLSASWSVSCTVNMRRREGMMSRDEGQDPQGLKRKAWTLADVLPTSHGAC